MQFFRWRFSLFQLLIFVVAVSFSLPLIAWKFHQWMNPRPDYLTDGIAFHKGSAQFSAVWLLDDSRKPLGGIAIFGPERPQLRISNRGVVRIDDISIPIPLDGKIHILDSNLQVHETNVSIESVASRNREWVKDLAIDIEKLSWNVPLDSSENGVRDGGDG